jgi:hypothetical protein
MLLLLLQSAAAPGVFDPKWAANVNKLVTWKDAN